MIASRALAKSWKSESGSQGSQINGFDKEIDKEIIASRALAKFWKSGTGSQGSQTDGFDKEFIKKNYSCRGPGQILAPACSPLFWHNIMLMLLE